MKKKVTSNDDEAKYFKIFNKQFSSFEQFMKFTMSRNFDSILVDIFTHHSYDTIPFKSESHKYRAFYKLFALMMPHRRWEYSPEYIENQPQEITQKMRKFLHQNFKMSAMSFINYAIWR
jgi:hypothetical protein